VRAHFSRGSISAINEYSFLCFVDRLLFLSQYYAGFLWI
jgi:hypothetical protein